ncbi:MAG: hypothetical protein GY866_33250 [Proteobacteria bacterium]|nr:hypothetical protein [Pseudomonadota bacterium]
MKPWKLLDTASIPGNGGELRLFRRDEEYAIRAPNGIDLMNSRVHGSEEALAELACKRIKDRKAPRVLVGGLGMGWTLAAALSRLGENGRVVVAELIPAVVEWNRKHLGRLAGYPLEDKRVVIREVDVVRLLKTDKNAYDAILLDVDNGPEAFTREENDWLYSRKGLAAAGASLKPSGILAVWSCSPNEAFTRRLSQAGFRVEVIPVRARGAKGGSRHTIWLAERAPSKKQNTKARANRARR